MLRFAVILAALLGCFQSLVRAQPQAQQPKVNWSIIPYESFGPLKFGMSPTEIAKHLGPPESARAAMPASASPELQKKFAGHTVEYRLGKTPQELKPTVHYADGKAVAFDIFGTMREAELGGFRLFEHSKEQAIAYLKKSSRQYVELTMSYPQEGSEQPVEVLDGHIFTDFGLSVSGDRSWEDSPPINMYARGEFDQTIADGIKAGGTKIVRGGRSD